MKLRLLQFALIVSLLAVSHAVFAGYRLTLRNGMVFEGNFSSVAGIAENPLVSNPTAGGVAVRSIVIVDDELRRTFFPHRELALPPTDAGLNEAPIKIRQRLAVNGPRVGSVGPILSATPFDEFGRRTVTVTTSKGRREIVQGITEISPIYTRLQGLRGSQGVDWDMRIATSSIPSDKLREILYNQAREKGSEASLDVVRLLFQSERFQEAAKELATAMEADPELKKLESLRQQLVQRGAQRLLDEIELRQAAGQHVYVSKLLRSFPSDGIATENLIRASDMLRKYDASIASGKSILEKLKPLVEKVEDVPRRRLAERLYDEIQSELNLSTLPRLADFDRFSDDASLGDDERLAIAISGWLLGQGEVIRNVAIATSLLEVRNLVHEYLRTMGDDKQAVREDLLNRIASREGGTPGYVAKLLANMRPPHDTPNASSIPGFYTVDVPGTPAGFPVRYQVQLPPEYDHYKRYPVVLSMHSLGSSADAQIIWWAGDWDPSLEMRRGQATRQGYIVIAPEWTTPGQRAYEYSAREHDIVLKSLRDAMRRFSIDSDRVYLSGHAAGGDAAWDISVAHPDLWAGIVLVGAREDYGDQSPRYVTFYDENAKSFPMYFVFGELDGNKLAENSTSLNRYMRPGYDVVVVQYKGRGNDHFYEELPRIFQWLDRQHRKPFPEEFEVHTMRPWDNYFWCLEFQGFPPRTMVSPFEWPAERPAAAEIRMKLGKNHINIRDGGAERTTVWLSPEFIDFDQRIEVSVGAKNVRDDIAPSLGTLLEDARTRADRQHVFWAKVEFP